MNLWASVLKLDTSNMARYLSVAQSLQLSPSRGSSGGSVSVPLEHQ